MVLEQLDNCKQKKKIQKSNDLNFTSYIKSNSKWITDLSASV